MTATGTLQDRYDGVTLDLLVARSGAPRLIALDVCSSTMDVAHEQAAAGAPHGTVVVASQQAAGRGRSGKTWISPAGAGVWTSVVLRPEVVAQGGVLSLRVGLELAARLDVLAGASVQLKWPNDLFVDGRKLGGILTEARWRGDQLEWIVVGVGVNVHPTTHEVDAASLAAAATCADVLVAIVDAVRCAAAGAAVLTDAECVRYAARDMTVGRTIESPLDGVVQGITADGGLRVQTATGDRVAVAGSLVFRTL